MMRTGRLRWVPWAIVVALLAAGLFPLYWMLVASVTPEARLFEAMPLVPRDLSAEH